MAPQGLKVNQRSWCARDLNPGLVGQTPRRYPIGHAAHYFSEFFFLVDTMISKKPKQLTNRKHRCYLPGVEFEVAQHSEVALLFHSSSLKLNSMIYLINSMYNRGKL